MSDTRPTAEVKPRKSETPTDKVAGLDILGLLKKAKSSPWVLVALALGGGKGGEEILTLVGQNVQWWWIAIAVAGYGALQYMADSAKRQEKITDQLGKINERLARGEEKFDNLEADVASLNNWRKDEQAAKSGKRKAAGSEGKLRTA